MSDYGLQEEGANIILYLAWVIYASGIEFAK
jgi:hypothetical protein